MLLGKELESSWIDITVGQECWGSPILILQYVVIEVYLRGFCCKSTSSFQIGVPDFCQVNFKFT